MAAEVPSTVEALEGLPGVGPYTARAVAAIAFRVPVGAVDTNVRRVLGRIAAGGPEGLGPVEMQALADAVVPHDRPDAWTHALMDLGARVCRPQSPAARTVPSSPGAGMRRASVLLAGARRRRRHAGPKRPEPAFSATTRWLRGRILERARDG